MYINCNVGDNQIGEKGSKGLSRGNWPFLKVISLGNYCVYKGSNKLGEKGVAYLSKAEWRKIQQVWLGTDLVT